jgi:hypothetical protein
MLRKVVNPAAQYSYHILVNSAHAKMSSYLAWLVQSAWGMVWNDRTDAEHYRIASALYIKNNCPDPLFLLFDRPY